MTSGLPNRPEEPDDREPVHFLDGLRCPACRTLNASWITADGTAVQCTECGEIACAAGDQTRGAA